MIKIQKSEIHGRGVFSTKIIPKGTLIKPKSIYGITGFNHSCEANVACTKLRTTYNHDLEAIKDILPNEELTITYLFGMKKFFCLCFKCKKERINDENTINITNFRKCR
jgi:SET domain-containing protein